MNSPLNLFYLLCCFVIMSCATPIVFFSQHTEDISKMRSSIEYSMDKYRLDLASTMKTIEIICNGLDIIDIELPFLESVHSRWKADMSRVPAYYDMNEVFLRRLLSSQDMRPLLAVESGSATPGYSDMPSPSSYDSIAQLLTHVGRDWTQMGRNVREVLYKRGIIQTLNKYISNHSEARVLVPGAGLGRLAAELAVDGYRVEANECSYAMICAMNTILNKILRDTSSSEHSADISAAMDTSQLGSVQKSHFQFFPRLLYQMADEWDFKNRFEAQLLPEGGDTENIERWLSSINSGSHKGQLVVQAGDFSVLYSCNERAATFDAVVTCFFVDTAAESILVYLSNIYDTLKPGGYWLNAGPLHYHKTSNIPYSHVFLEEIIVASGFEKIKANVAMTDYCGEENITMRPELYRIPITVYKKMLRSGDHQLDKRKIERILSAMRNFGENENYASDVYGSFAAIKEKLYVADEEVEIDEP